MNDPPPNNANNPPTPPTVPISTSNAANPWGDAPTPFDQIGGEPAVRALVDAFYDRMRDDAPRLRDMHPQYLTESRQKLFEFLVGWLGGPPLYIQKHGHPRLRMRHMPFPIDQHAVDEWLRCMRAAMDERNIVHPLRSFLDSRFVHTAQFMQNRD